MPHPGREEHKLSLLRLNGASWLKFQRELLWRFAEDEPAGVRPVTFAAAWQGDVQSRADPTLWMDMIGVEAGTAKPHRPTSGKSDGAVPSARKQRMLCLDRRQSRDVAFHGGGDG